jgi:hypothetical protein
MVKMDEVPVSGSESVATNDGIFKKIKELVDKASDYIYSQEDFQTVKDKCVDQFKDIDSLEKFRSLDKKVFLQKTTECLPGMKRVVDVLNKKPNGSDSFYKDKSILMIMFSFVLFAMLY